jgi:cytochrome P450
MGALLEFQSTTPEFTDRALQANLAGLVFAGHETTTNLIGSALLHLYSRPEVFEALSADRSKVRALVDETLRFDGPVQRVNRVATEEITIDDVTIQPGQDVYLLLGAANRDPSVFVEPNEFRIDRPEPEHLTFGFGRHICPGSQLAKAEAVAAIEAMLDLGKPVIESYEWRQNLSLRGLSTLNLAWAT